MRKRDQQWHERRLARLLEGVPEERHAGLLACDPTPHKEFAGYLGRLYRQSSRVERARLIDEDAGKARAYLWATEKLNGMELKIKLHAEAGATATRVFFLPELLQTIEPHLPRLSEQPLSPDAKLWLGEEIANVQPVVESNNKTYSAEEQALLDSGSLEIVFDQGPLKLWKINDHAGAKFAGRGTKWCTTEADGENFKYYHEKGSLFALAVRGGADKYQFHFKEFQITNTQDEVIDFQKFVFEELPGSLDQACEFMDALSGAALRDGKKRNYCPDLHQFWIMPEKQQVALCGLVKIHLDHTEKGFYIAETLLKHMNRFTPEIQIEALQAIAPLIQSIDSPEQHYLANSVSKKLPILSWKAREVGENFLSAFCSTPTLPYGTSRRPSAPSAG